MTPPRRSGRTTPDCVVNLPAWYSHVLLHVPTLYVASLLSSLTVAAVIALIWRQNPDMRALRWWSSAYAVWSLGIALLLLRGSISDWVSILGANVVLGLSQGLLWAGARVFNGRSPAALWLMLVPAAWIGAAQIPGFLESPPARIGLSSLVIVLLIGATGYELWRGRSEALATRLPTVILCFIHAGVFLLTGISACFAFKIEFVIAAPPVWFTLRVVESYLFSIASGLTFVALVKERAERLQHAAAVTDPLTGVLNRRAFFDQGEKFLRKAADDLAPISVIIFDLDRFKSINDRYGHAAGDHLLVVFARTASGDMRRTDLFGRIGGEEFAALVLGTAADASMIAERIQVDFRGRHVDSVAGAVRTTVSAGISPRRANETLAALMARADRALYLAKRNGRDRVESIVV